MIVVVVVLDTGSWEDIVVGIVLGIEEHTEVPSSGYLDLRIGFEEGFAWIVVGRVVVVEPSYASTGNVEANVPQDFYQKFDKTHNKDFAFALAASGLGLGFDSLV